MSDYLHDRKKFADSGLQLRLPVDLIPPTQYGRLTNAIPVIEGQVTTRAGVTQLEIPTEVAFVNSIGRVNTGTTQATLVNVVNACGFRIGDHVTINLIALNPGELSTVTLGTYNDIVAQLNYPETQITLITGFPATWSGANQTLFLFGMITSASQPNQLPNTVINNIWRLNESVGNIASDRLFSIGGRIWHENLSSGVLEELLSVLAPGASVPTATLGLSGRPLSIINFRPTLDTLTWAIIADQNQMYKYRPSSSILTAEFAPLGNAPPTIPDTASAGGVGNLNSSGGVGYDWRNTNVDGFALTESNPSPINQTTGNVSENATTTTNHGFTGLTVTTGVGTASAFGGNTVPASQTVSCQWAGFAVPGGTITALTLNVKLTANGSASSAQNSGSSTTVTLSYSFDGGTSFSTLLNLGAGSGGGVNGPGNPFNVGGTYQATIPSSASPANIVLNAQVTANASGGPGAFANASSTVNITNIFLTVAFQSATNTLSLTNQSANVCVQVPPGPQYKFINLYRRGGSLGDNWRLVGQFQVSTLTQGGCGAGTLQINDNVSDTTLSTAAILQLDNNQPVSSVTVPVQPLPFIWGPFGVDARVLGCGDPGRPDCVYFSKSGNMDSWPPQNFVEVCDPGTPVIAGCVFNTRCFAFSQESVYELVEGLGSGATFTPFRTPASRGLFAPQGLAVGPAMFFISKDGIYASVGGQEQSIVENDIKPIFPTYDTPGQSVEGYESVDYTQPDAMRLRYHSNELYFIYKGFPSGTRQTLVYDILKKRWRAAKYSVPISEAYSEPATVQSLLLGTNAGVIYETGGTTDPTEVGLLEGVAITTVAATTTLTNTLYNARVSALTAAGEVLMSSDVQSLALSSTIGLQVNFPSAPPGVISWRVYFGFQTIPGGENQFQAFTEAAVAAAGRIIVITAPGTAGSIPTLNANPNIAFDLRTGAHDQGAPLNQKQYGNVIIDLDPGGATVGQPVVITPLINGETVTNAAINVTGAGRQQVPLNLTDYFAFNTEYEITWTRTSTINPILYQYDTLHFLEPVQVTHWRSTPTSFEFPGYVHCRDAYVAIRSQALVTLTMVFDAGTGAEVTQVYTIPSTGNIRLKQYIQFAPNKGLLYRFSLDSAQSFRVYAPDLEIRVKPWLGLLGYSTQRVLGGEAQ